MRDNHYGPMFEQVKIMFPNAVRFHWHVNAFNAEDQYWMVGSEIQTGGANGIFWENVKLSEIQ